MARVGGSGWIAIACALSAVLAPPAAAEPMALVFPLRVHMGNGLVPPDPLEEAWLDAQVASASQIFGAYGVGFRRRSRIPLETGLDVIESHRELRRTRRYLDPRSIDVFVVARLDGLDDDDGAVLGITDPHRQSSRHCVVLEAGSAPHVLAHELGHYFGLSHSRLGLMYAYAHGGGAATLDASQGAAILERAHGFALSQRPAPIHDVH